MRDELDKQLRSEALRRYGSWLPEDLASAPLDELVTAVGELEQSQAGMDVFRTLARMPLPIFITTNPGNLLTEALKEVEVEVNGVQQRKDPVVEICRWNDDLVALPSIFESDRGYRPSVERPLVFHLFGRLSEPDSLVITVDASNKAPTATIESMLPNPTSEGEEVTLAGRGDDPDGTIEVYAWRSDKDGFLGSEAIVTTSTLSASGEVCARGEVVAVQAPPHLIPED